MTSIWQHHLRNCNRTSELPKRLKTDQLNYIDDSAFPFKAPETWLKRIKSADPSDPLLRQVLPIAEENIDHSDFTDDPIGDLDAISGNGIIHKYHGRVLLIVTEVCAIHCRYCFRRHFPYRENSIAQRTDQMLNAVAQDETIEEVILSGGDPLTLSNNKLFALCEALESIPHIRYIRIHTRMPIVIAQRIDEEFVKWSKQRRKPYTMVVHINHPDEIDDSVKHAMQTLSHWQLLNQAVLLKGVNDNAEILINLSKQCFSAGITPYYLHMFDKVAGASHFDVNLSTAKSLMRTVSAQLPGYLVPKLVQENKGASAKQIIAY